MAAVLAAWISLYPLLRALPPAAAALPSCCCAPAPFLCTCHVPAWQETEALKNISQWGWRTEVLDATFPTTEGPEGLEAAVARLRVS